MKVFNAAYAEYAANRTGLLATGALSSALLSYHQILRPVNVKPVNATKVLFNPPSDNMNPAARANQNSLILNDLHYPHECFAQEIDNAGGISPQLANHSF